MGNFAEKINPDLHAPDLPMKDDEFIMFRDLIHERTGIFLDDRRRLRLTYIMGDRMKANKLSTYFEYYYALRFGKQSEWDTVIDRIIVPETRFFRNQPLWKEIEEKILPEISSLKREQGDLTLNFWSAGCCTGEEAYSLAMCALKVLKDHENWRINIYGSDISEHVIDEAHKGKYRERSLVDMSREDINRFLKKSGEMYEVIDEVRSLVKFQQMNLIDFDKIKSLPNMDFIFCANVIMYFSEKYQNQVLRALADKLLDPGYLFTGWAEILDIEMSPYEAHFLKEAICYRLKKEKV